MGSSDKATEAARARLIEWVKMSHRKVGPQMLALRIKACQGMMPCPNPALHAAEAMIQAVAWSQAGAEPAAEPDRDRHTGFAR
jgi:hypothetical protein